MRDETVGADEVFVIGDNRSMSLQAHEFGLARRDAILASCGLQKPQRRV